MKELLEEFCRLAPEAWGAAMGDGIYVKLWNAAWDAPVLDPASDIASAKALVFLLDWLEGHGWAVALEPLYAFGGGKKSHVCGYRYLGRKNIMGNGKTRIEAVVRACVEVLKEGEGS